MPNYVYVFVRKDLSFPQIAVQACHAIIDAREFYPADLEAPNLVLIGVNDENKLVNTLRRISELGIRCKAFYEPDIGDRLTAIATEPVSGATRRHFKKYQLFNLQPRRSWITACLSFFTFLGGK